MLIRPVLDIRGGLVVRGVAGRRDRYTPWRPDWCRSADPLTFARRVRDRWSPPRLYLADLDGLEQGGPASPRAHRDLWHDLVADGFDLLLDPGVRQSGDISPRLTPADSRIIAASESIGSLKEWNACVADSRCVLGLDLRGGEPLGPPGVTDFAWRSSAPVLVLDVAAVGVGQGTPTLNLCRELRAANPTRTLLTGGGVRGAADLHAAAAAGVDELLVASALYDGRLSGDDLRPFLPEA